MAHGHGGRLALDRVLEHGEERRVALAALELAREQQRRAPLGVLGARTRTWLDTCRYARPVRTGRPAAQATGRPRLAGAALRRALRS